MLDNEKLSNDEHDDESSLSSSSDDEDDENDVDKKQQNEERLPNRVFLPGEEIPEGEELVFDESCYVLYHQANLGAACLSFDLISANDVNNQSEGSMFEFPLSIYGVAGTQAAVAGKDAILVFKMSNLHRISICSADDESNDEDDENQEEKKPKLSIVSIPHAGAVNRVRFYSMGPSTPLVASWSEKGIVNIWSIEKSLKRLEQGSHSDSRPTSLYSFNGHPTEGYGLAWSCMQPGYLATGDCRRNIFIWRPGQGGTWQVDQRSLMGHEASVEDLCWAPNEANVLASGSVDRSIRIWDIRAAPQKACMITLKDVHELDVNVIDWNPELPLLASGGDDGVLSVWDLRNGNEVGEPVARFKHHKAPITSVEWHPTDTSVLASSGSISDDQIALWNLSVEKDNDMDDIDDNLPPQLMFIHQGLTDIKELHWHKKMHGMVLSTSVKGIDVFRTICI